MMRGNRDYQMSISKRVETQEDLISSEREYIELVLDTLNGNIRFTDESLPIYYPNLFFYYEYRKMQQSKDEIKEDAIGFLEYDRNLIIAEIEAIETSIEDLIFLKRRKEILDNGIIEFLKN